MTTRRLLATVAIALTAALAVACGSNSTANDAAVRPDGTVDLSKVTLRIGDQKGTGIQSLLQSAGELGQVPYKISWSQYTSGPPILEAINAGAVDVGAVGDAPPIFAASAGSRIKIVSSYDNGVAGQAILVPKDSSITSPDQLRGKKIAVAKGSSAHYELLAVLNKAGLSFSDIKPQYLQPPDALAAFSSGQVDAWAIWDPYTEQGQQQTGARVLVDGTNYHLGNSFVIAGQEALADKATAAAVGDFIGRFQRAQLWANGHTTEWAQTLAQLTRLPSAVTLASTQRDRITEHRLDAATIADEQQVADAFYAAKLIPHKVTIADYVDPRFNDLLPPS